MKFCPYCGADLLDDNVLFCGQCGKKLPPHEAGITEPLTEEMRPEQEAPKPVPTKEKRKKKKKMANRGVCIWDLVRRVPGMRVFAKTEKLRV